ncbi:hypothetical protein HCJ93_08535 [Streptomyces sp. SBST2-5]|uniref:Restriction endonuclease n=1 Tax=Streptomyces composti TaxID=2720025 RepID=A0ABX1A4X9_9ACTN|nr:hypothetical protein [Streptomyces composti]NJP50117.1 hypothetical protein [Streptomyces composti]
MSQSLAVRCPECRRAHRYTAPSYPCACGAPVVPPLDADGEPTRVEHRAWQEDWITVLCGSCGRRGQWPRPELGCPCGTVLRIPVTADAPRRPALPSVTIRTARDAVTAVVLYLHRLGYAGIRRADHRPPSGIGLAGRGVLAHVDPSARPATLRDVECLWLTAMTESAGCLYFSVTGYTKESHARAGTLGIPLFLLERSGAVTPVNPPADQLDGSGA